LRHRGIGLYVVQKHLNVGGEGSVDLAKHHRTGQLVAIKTPLRPDLNKRMQAEARLFMKAGKSANIIGFVGFDVLGDSCQMALEAAICDLYELVGDSPVTLDLAA